MKVRIVCFSALVGVPLLLACLCATVAYGAGVTVVGPGPRPLLYITDPGDYRVLDGTQIISPSRSGPPATFVVVTDAIEFRGGGDIQIDGGYFRGGDATYAGANDDSARASAGDALHLRQSTGTVYGGTFIGGAASSTTSSARASGGEGLILVESTLRVYDGYFQGGVGTGPNFLGETYEFQAAGAFLADSSALYLHGGDFSGSIEILSGSTLFIFGRDYQVDGMYVSGEYANGSRFRHHIVNYGGALVMRGIPIPEPTTAVLAVIFGGIAAGCSRWRLFG